MPFRKSHIRSLCVFLLLLLQLLQLQPAEAQQFHFVDNRKRDNIAFKLIKNLIIVPMYINGKGPFNFVLDTGVGLMIITDPGLVDSLQLKNLRTLKIVGFGEGNELSAWVSPDLKARVGSTEADAIPAAILKKDVFELSAFVGMPVHGLIGYEFFNSFAVRINYQLGQLTVYKSESLFRPKGYKVPITIEDQKPYMVTQLTLSNGQKIPIKLIIDSGAGHPISLEMYRNQPFELPPINIAANLGMGLSGLITGYLGRVPALELGKYKLNNVIAAFPNYKDAAAKITNAGRNGNMGNAILKRFEVTFDYGHQSVYLKPSIYFKENFEHDMSGMELTTGGKEYDRVLVTRVEPESPADVAGIERDDELLSINFKPVNEIGMQEIDNLMHSRNERSFLIEIYKAKTKKRERVIVTLQRRI